MTSMYKNSVIEYFGQGEGHSCGYCKSKDTNFSYGMWGHILQVSDYQDLIDRGWRRSGCYLYKPQLNIQCCPMYTMKCDATKFKLSNSQKKVIKNVNRYLNFGMEPNSKTNASGAEKELDDGGKEDVKIKHIPKPGLGMDANKPKCKKAKLIRAEKKKEKMMKRDGTGDDGSTASPAKPSNSSKLLEQYLGETADNPRHKLRIELIRSRSESNVIDAAHPLYAKYQTIIHNDEPSEVGRRQFTRFLIKSALSEGESNIHGHPGYGSFHQRYWIDDRLVAVGVIDILPRCVSSVYLFYDPDFNFLSLGIYAALREIEFVRKLCVLEENLCNYYMGFYIHSCQKMRYKAQFHPSFLLCPETCSWHPIENCLPQLDSIKYSRFAPHNATDEEGSSSNFRDVLVLSGNVVMRYGQHRGRVSAGSEDLEKVKEYAHLVGKKLAEKMLLFRH